MIRFRLKERMADLSFKLGRRVSVEEVAAATGIHRLTLGKIANKKGYNCTTDSLDRLCIYFDCKLEDLAEFVHELDEVSVTDAPQSAHASARTAPTAKTPAGSGGGRSRK